MRAQLALLIALLTIGSFAIADEKYPFAVAGHWRYWQDVQSTQVRWVRMWAGDGAALWGEIQPTSLDSFYWDDLDQWVRAADSAGFSIMLTIRTGGDSTSKYPCKWTDTSFEPDIGEAPSTYPSASFPPQHLDDWYRFVFAVVKRYDGTQRDEQGRLLPPVRHFETQGENDEPVYWYGTREEYFDAFLPVFYRAVHDANPNAVVIAPSLTGHGLGLAIIDEMIQQGQPPQTIVDFATRYFGEVNPLFDITWEKIQEYLARQNVQRQIAFISYSYHTSNDSVFYDRRGFHTYESWWSIRKAIRFERDMMQANGYYRPQWGTEVGIVDVRGFPNVPEEEHAARTIKKLISGLAAGAEWQCYSPMYNVNVPLLNRFLPLFKWTLLGLVPHQARDSFAFIAQKMSGDKRYRFQQETHVDSLDIYTFESESGTFMCLWVDGEGSINYRLPLPPAVSQVSLYNYLGQETILPVQGAVDLLVSDMPVFVEWQKTTSVVEVPRAPAMPGLEVFPNPFNTGATIRFTLARPQWVGLRLFNVVGQEVATLVENRLPPGQHMIHFDGTEWPAGIYFCRLEAVDSQHVVRLLLLK